MKEKIEKILSIIKKDGPINAIRKIIKYVNSNYLFKYNIILLIQSKLGKKKYEKIIDVALSQDFDRIIIWRSTFGWNVPLFQRPQHISVNLAKQKCLVFYEVTTMTDSIKTIDKIKNNLFLVNFNNKVIKKLLFDKLNDVNKTKYIQIYSTDCNMTLDELKQYINNGYKVIYEYIDDLSPELIGTKELPKNLIDKYNYAMNNTKDIFVVVTADELKKDVVQKRGREKLIFACNGVDYDFFKQIDDTFEFNEQYRKILSLNQPIIGYYGALASWFDYELVKYIAKERPNYQIVLIGIKYDDSFEKAELNSYSNIHFIGSIDYKILKNYAYQFNVCMIPFIINDITKATSPLKLFEYMALGKPIITTPMKECIKYESVFIASDYDEFIKIIDELINVENKNYYKILDYEARQNSWKEKAKIIVNYISGYEKKE